MALAAILLLCVLALTFMAEAPQAHVYKHIDGDRKFFFDGSTREEGNLSDEVDPLNVIFYGGQGPKSPGFLGDILAANDLPGVCGSSQRVIFRKFGADGYTRSKVEAMQVGERRTDGLLNCQGIEGRMHMRLWNDHEHYHMTANHPRPNMWMIGGVHRDATITHKPGMGWDDARRWLVDRLDGMCHWRKWKLLPSARGEHQEIYNTGWVARFATAAPNTCGQG